MIVIVMVVDVIVGVYVCLSVSIVDLFFFSAERIESCSEEQR